jgi:hypothetical protein
VARPAAASRHCGPQATAGDLEVDDAFGDELLHLGQEDELAEPVDE